MKEREKAILIKLCLGEGFDYDFAESTYLWLIGIWEHISSAKAPALSSVKTFETPLRISVSLETEKESDADAPNQQVNALHVQKQSIVKKKKTEHYFYYAQNEAEGK